MKIIYVLYILTLYKNEWDKNKLYKELTEIKSDSKFDILLLKNSANHKYLNEFDVKDLYNIELKTKKSFTIYQNFDIKNFSNSVFWICFVMSKTNKINIKIESEGNVYYNKNFSSTTIIKIIPKQDSKIKVIYKNLGKSKFKFINGYDCSNCKKKKVLSNKKDVQSTLDNLNKIHKENSLLYLEHEDLNINQYDHLTQIKEINKKVYRYTCFEFFFILLINAYQIYLLKKLTNNKDLI